MMFEYWHILLTLGVLGILFNSLENKFKKKKKTILTIEAKLLAVWRKDTLDLACVLRASESG